MYGIGNRPVFHNYIAPLPFSKPGSAYFNSKDLKRYYSSLDVELYFNNYYVDEIVQLQFVVNQSVMPLVGFNSYTYDEVAVGSRIIQGTFTINFTSPGYLYKLLEEIEKNDQSPNPWQMVPKEEENNLTGDGEETESLSYDRKPLWRTSFDIDIMYGQDTNLSKAQHYILEGVVLTGCQQEFNTSGQPITETYTFIAKDIRHINE